jgi:hypothetical protein
MCNNTVHHIRLLRLIERDKKQRLLLKFILLNEIKHEYWRLYRPTNTLRVINRLGNIPLCFNKV